jgi:F-type H+-transporting ATPase subunit gamma
MANLKEVRTRIASVKSTQQITSAMKMVSASKLKRAQNAILKLRPYASKLKEILENLSESLENSADDVYTKERKLQRVLLIVVTSNRGLCGAFNSSVTKLAQIRIISEYSNLYQQGKLDIFCIGKKGAEYFNRRKISLIDENTAIFDALTFENVAPMAEKLMKDFSDGTYDRIEVIYNQFKNAASQILVSEQFLPLMPSTAKKEISHVNLDYIFEPGKEQIVSELIPRSLKLQFFKMLLDSNASENGARMTAMHKATDNASEMIKMLRLSYNKARQATITNEILEIVSGAEALKG